MLVQVSMRGRFIMLSSRLKAARKNKKLTQDGLARAVNTTKATISNYENEYSSPSNEALVKIADVLECTTDYLLGRSDYPSMDKEGSDFAKKYGIFESKNEERDFAMDYESWTEEEKEEMREFVRFKMEQRKKKRNK